MKLAIFFGGSASVEGQIQAVIDAENDGFEGMWGLKYDRPAVHMRDYLCVLLPLIREGRASFSGEFFRVNATVQVPVPKPPPVLIAALAPVMLRLAGEMADGTITWMAGPKTL